ncbi:MAG: RNA polymerase factor sigma-54 [Arenicella sp.]|nr:RNA polymerase factor sigma-54 [Arenicella sp.]
MKQSLNLKVSQQLSLTPQLKQSLKLLQLSGIDLEQEIQQALDANPMLEYEEDAPGPDEKPIDLAETETYQIPQPIAESADPSVEIERIDNLAPEQDLAASWQESFEPSRVANSNSGAGNDLPENVQVTSGAESLFDHLNWQIRMTNLSDKDQLICRSLLRSIDEEGYLRIDPAEMAALFDEQLEVEESEVRAMLSLIKTLDPIGVGARDLSDRLLIFLSQLDTDTAGLDHAKLIISEHLDLLANHNLAQLKKILELDDQQLTASLELIMQLNPRVTSEFKSTVEDYIIPDVLVKKVANRWVAAINPDNQHKLRVNETYSRMLKSNIDKQGSEFIHQNLQQAKTFIKGLMSRYDTLHLVGQAIVERQQAFFDNGPESMQPMVLQDVAQELNLHESTISRATAGKYLQSPRGVYELKYFFSSALNSVEGATSSSIAIRSLIKKMIDSEPGAKPLSDSKIAQELEKLGHIVARRTVAKYRESMHIASSSQRKSLV